MKVDDLLESNLLTPLNGARIVYLDGRLHETALVVAHEVITFITYYFHKLILPFVVYLEPPDIHVLSSNCIVFFNPLSVFHFIIFFW